MLEAKITREDEENRILLLEDDTEIANYKLLEVLGDQPQRKTYKAQLGNDFVSIKVLTTIHPLEKIGKIGDNVLALNTALDQNLRVAYTVDSNGEYIVAISDWIEGKNLEEVLEGRGKVFSEEEVVAFLRDLLSNDVRKLHDNGIVHGDIHPNNIIQTPDGEYRLIDLVHPRENATDISITINASGRQGYSTFNPKKSPQDDFFGLARTAMHLLGGKPLPLEDTWEAKNNDLDRLGRYSLNSKITSILYRMLGHEETKYENSSQILGDIDKNNALELRPLKSIESNQDPLHFYHVNAYLWRPEDISDRRPLRAIAPASSPEEAMEIVERAYYSRFGSCPFYCIEVTSASPTDLSQFRSPPNYWQSIKQGALRRIHTLINGKRELDSNTQRELQSTIEKMSLQRIV